ncbi:MAG: DUF1190 domain-containing protein [Timaviella obliquedivisa GSE-PSE-MK23-08B]|jgi:uncharacterized protein YgiB involved in biofilm formation|nr:DUF1190 domain-containing protein [Timaviella obliquedivisa GSE-PSE-MK23-08B]
MTQDNNRSTTIRYLLIASGVLVVGGLGYLAYDLLNPYQNVRYYASEQQCIIDAIARQNAMSQEQCQAQFQYAFQEYERVAPVYRSQAECQEDTAGICSQVFDLSIGALGWRPDFGGFYFVDDVGNGSNLNSIYVGTTRYTVYPVQPVYRSTAGIVTPARIQIASPQTGVPLESRYFSRSTTIPTRPKGHAAQGTIKGRGNFGNSVRSTAPRGAGGK